MFHEITGSDRHDSPRLSFHGLFPSVNLQMRAMIVPESCLGSSVMGHLLSGMLSHGTWATANDRMGRTVHLAGARNGGIERVAVFESEIDKGSQPSAGRCARCDSSG